MVYLELMRELDQAAEKMHNRLNRTVNALNEAKVDYAVIGGNAVASWLAKVGVDIHTRDVDILLRKSDIPQAETALQNVGFVRRNVGRFTMFLDGPNARARDAVHVVYAGEKYRDSDSIPTPDVSETEEIGGVRVLSLKALTLIKLTAFRSKDRAHLIELLREGLIDQSMAEKLPDILIDRFQEVISEFKSTQEEWL